MRQQARTTADVLSLFYLPSVRHISSIATILAPRWPLVAQPDASNLTSLELTLVREGHLGQILSVTRNLQKLRWGWFYREDLTECDKCVTNVIDLDKIVTDLSHVRDTLTDLTITAWTEADPFLPQLLTTGSFEGMTHFAALTSLEAPLPFLLGYSPLESGYNPDSPTNEERLYSEPRVHALSESPSKRLQHVLPRNIRHLTVTDDLYLQDEYDWLDVDLLALIRFWLAEWKTCTPRLQGVHVLLNIMDCEEWGPEIRQEFVELCSTAGIQGKVTKVAGDM